jgi:putative nucleotidyltransferase with HDIG domain
VTGSAVVTRPFVLITLVVVSIGVGSLVAAWVEAPPQLGVPLLLLLLAILLSENYAFALPDYSVSLSYPLAMAAVVLGGPAAAGLVASASFTNYREIRARRSPAFLAFNLGQMSLVGTSGAYLFQLLGGRFMLSSQHAGLLPFRSADFPHILLPMMLVAVWCAAGNMLLTASAAAALGIQPFRKQLRAMFAFMPTQIALAFVGYLVAQVIALNVVALPLFVAPLVVARQLYMRYAGLREAYADTIRSLVGALEAKDPYTRGHSERVSEYASELGLAMGLESRLLERLAWAALLHDLGKLAVPGAILTKPDRLADDEMDRIRAHPSQGADMVRRIPPLRDLGNTVSQHHERVDGTGYPSGVLGSDLSIEARILAVADSFDAMTTTRAYRPALSREQAVSELVDGAGTQFDEGVVEVFVEARVGVGSGQSTEQRVGGRVWYDQSNPGRG